MVNVEDNVHTVVDSVVKNLLNTVEPLFAYVIVLVNVVVPRNRKTQCSKAGSLHSVDYSLGSFYATPVAFEIHFICNLAVVAYSIKCISEVDTELHIGNKFKAVESRYAFCLNVKLRNSVIAVSFRSSA
ncbi:MAG: hypothetical protein BWY70_01689 [Bacteroidetes bacterium ADurb.Bin408]|nr:MAG: hypothetical protein BWY70_01689 [Bacteroidetes bacterium ADurb.Bin408]